MPGYMDANCQLTLGEGLAEYRAAHPGLLRDDAVSPGARAFYRGHDVVHVLWGCDTSLNDEAVVKLASMFGTTAGWSVLKAYELPETRDIYRRLNPLDVMATVVAAFAIVPRTLVRCLRQRRRWPFDAPDGLLDRRLADLRREYAITVAHP